MIKLFITTKYIYNPDKTKTVNISSQKAFKKCVEQSIKYAHFSVSHGCYPWITNNRNDQAYPLSKICAVNGRWTSYLGPTKTVEENCLRSININVGREADVSSPLVIDSNVQKTHKTKGSFKVELQRPWTTSLKRLITSDGRYVKHLKLMIHFT